MATKVKYYRIKPAKDEKEEKLDTDILMRFSNTYGILIKTQASTSRVGSPFSLVKIKTLSPSRLPKSLWIVPFGCLKCCAARFKGYTR